MITTDKCQVVHLSDTEAVALADSELRFVSFMLFLPKSSAATAWVPQLLPVDGAYPIARIKDVKVHSYGCRAETAQSPARLILNHAS